MKSKLAGITLLESLLYLALFGVVFISMIQFVFSISDNNLISDMNNEIKKAGIFLNEHLDDSFYRSTSVDTANSTFNSDNGVLRFNLPSGSLQYNLANGRVNFTEDSVNYFLTNTDLHIDQMLVERINNSNGEIEGVRITFTISSVQRPAISDSFVNSYVYK